MHQSSDHDIWNILQSVYDPEIPVLSVVDMGIIRKLSRSADEVVIHITPTYTGCPAMDVISVQIRMALLAAGFPSVKIVQELSPAWTTDWISEEGKQKLKAYGIAPPLGKAIDSVWLEDLKVPCPQCNSTNTVLVSQFGSTACKALFKCLDCKEPFDYFKCH